MQLRNDEIFEKDARMRGGFYRRWLARGLRLSIVVGLVSASWGAWSVFSHYDRERWSWRETRLLYECAAGLDDEALKAQMTEYGTINMKGICSFDGENHWVRFTEIEAVRRGGLEFEPISEPFSIHRTVTAGLLGFIASAFMTVALLSLIRLSQWVWGRTGN